MTTTDLQICGGVVVDGTGAPGRPADIAVADGRIVEIAESGGLATASTRRIDADGLVVAPGFIDVHTHLDAQVFWDPSCSPSILHGVTTVVGGNCGYSIAPLAPPETEYVMRLLAAVEDIPIAALASGVPWNWRSMGDYLDRVEAMRPVPNVGFLVGHSLLRRAVMGSDAVGSPASQAQIEAMADLLRRSLAEGGLGLGTSQSVQHRDGEGDPVPSRAASLTELLALGGVVAEAPGTTMQLIPIGGGGGSVERQQDAHKQLGAGGDVSFLTQLSLAADRPVNWNILRLSEQGSAERITWSDAAARAGARVLALMYPGPEQSFGSFERRGLFNRIGGMEDFATAPASARLAELADREQRARLGTLARGAHPWDRFVVDEGFTAEVRALEGQSVGDIATRTDQDPWDVICDIVVADQLRTRFERPRRNNSAADWQMRLKAWNDPRIVIGASDAGAHMTSLATWDFATEFLRQNRDHRALPLEQAVYRLTGHQAGLYGLAGRGQISAGAAADVVIFDPHTIAPDRVRTVTDLPGGTSRLFSNAVGIVYVLVNGAEVVHEGVLTGRAPGRVLRSGRDTVTVRARS
jgi:N-acyl-D-aspartate/D-glutamate deacylase